MPSYSEARPCRSLEDFRGDFEQLAKFMQRSWGENKSQPLLYTSEILASYFSSPGATFALAPTLYEDSQIVGFIAGFPRTLLYQGKTLQVIIVSFLTVLSEYKKSGYGFVLWNEMVKRAKTAGYAGVVNFCVDGDSMNSIMLGCYQRMRVPATKIFSIRYLTRLILEKRGIEEQGPAPPGHIVESFREAASALADRIPLCRIWSWEEAEWQCLGRANSIIVSHYSGENRGFLTGYVMSLADGDGTKCVFVEDILWDDLGFEQRRAMVQELVKRSAAMGARMVVVPLQGYADPEPFLKSRFVRSPRILHAYLSLWDEGPQHEPLDSFYFDVF